ncbi:MAG: hypothetical protein IJR49_05120 [Treponema sp.]|nr:hypothetical protein [Treponema sp.]
MFDFFDEFHKESNNPLIYIDVSMVSVNLNAIFLKLRLTLTFRYIPMLLLTSVVKKCFVK